MTSRWIGFAALAIAAGSIAASGCDEGGGCKQEERIAIELTVRNVAGRELAVTAELDGNGEQSCDRTSDLNVGVQAGGRIFTCIEQGGGTYTVRVYGDDEALLYEEEIEVEADACHVKELVRAEVDLGS